MRSTGSRALAALAAACAIALAVARPAGAAEPEWNVARIGAPASAAGVLVAVVDTGVDGTHPALAGRVERTIDLVDGSGGDPNGHGTHVAGTVAGADAGCGAIGVTPDARILPVRVLDEDGAGRVDAVADGIRRAADAGATVINLSLGTDVVLRDIDGSGAALRDAVEYAWGRGSIPVLAAGNDGLLGGVFGSGYGGLPAVVVTATDHQDRVAAYATPIGSADWGIAAPGGDTSGQQGRDILSAYPDRRCALNGGTSMAAPHVSAALAALRAAGHDRTAAVQRLLATARDLGSPGPDSTYGHGLVDLRAALGQASPPPPHTAPPPPSPPPPAPEPAPPTTGATGAPARADDPRPTAGPAPAGAPSPDVDADPADQAAPSTTRVSAPPEADAGGVTAIGASEDDDGDDGTPTGLIAVAVAALGIAGAGSGVAVRRLGRGRAGSGRPQP